MGLTFQQKFYNIGDEVFIVHNKAHGGNCKVIALVEVSEDENYNIVKENGARAVFFLKVFTIFARCDIIMAKGSF